MASRHQPTQSDELRTLKEKVQLRKIDREVSISQTHAVIDNANEEKLALQVGNDCLTHMAKRLLQMPVNLNAAVFENRSRREKRRMKNVLLEESIGLNEDLLFKSGKQLLKQDYIAKKKANSLKTVEEDLEIAKVQAKFSKTDYQERHDRYLHLQVMVNDSRDRENAAKLTYQRMQKILDELNKDLVAIPRRIHDKEKQITNSSNELRDFTELKDRAVKYLVAEKEALEPWNQEAAGVVQYFETRILKTRDELDDRRKSVSLAKFLAEREAHALSFYDTENNAMEVQRKRRNKISGAYDMIDALKDATIVSDIEHVVDCFKDQDDLVVLLKNEKTLIEEKNAQLEEKLSRLAGTNLYMRYDVTKMAQLTDKYVELVAEELKLARHFEESLTTLKDLDLLMSSLTVIVHSLAEKLRPIKLQDEQSTGKTIATMANNTLVTNAETVVKKLEKMLDIVKNNTVPVGPVKPNWLELYKEERVPPDAVRLNLNPVGRALSMSSFEAYGSDVPGFMTREMMKARCADRLEQEKKKKSGNNDKGGKKR